jgi:cytochrome c biogenesis protein CcmG/thiol:disulfide interchange protein DsbE
VGVKRTILWLPLGIFVLFVLTVAYGLTRTPETTVRSQLIGKPMPDFALEPSVADHPPLRSADLRAGRPRLINVFASWCAPCKVEAPQLMALKERGIPIDGIAIRDRSEDVARFLAESGDPFERIGADPNSRVQFALGSSGVPETFVVDGRGIIRHQHIGEIRPEHMGEIVAAWEAAR